MMSTAKKLSIAFLWNMHQPVYQLDFQSDFLMPWVRLHSVKNYLEMILAADKYNNIKLNFNLTPVLLDSLLAYAEDGAHDIHSRLCVTDMNELTDDDKEFILNNFFDAEYSTMIFPYENYNLLYQKRFSEDEVNINKFSNQEYADIMAWYNLVWINSNLRPLFPDIEKLINKGKDFSLEDRTNIIDIHRKIVSMIIPECQKRWENGKIELSTSPYYYPILPILFDVKNSQKKLATIDSTLFDLDMKDDARAQTELALDRFEEIFDKRPKGIMASELGVCPKTMDSFANLGVDWTISDEGILSKAIQFDFVRDFKGHLENPYYLMKTYKYKTLSNEIKIIFRDSVIPSLISFEYSNHEPQKAANDLYNRIKVMQDKIQQSPDDNHLLTIAMNGENCWEGYENDGNNFLKEFYTLIEKDKSLETVLISDYVEKDKNLKDLKKLPSGSWINKNFQFWIGEPVKNLAWNYLKNVKEDFETYKKNNPNDKNIEFAHKELMICQGGDWFWWYGEPNDSGQDHIFDYLFREHLKNVYRFLYLDAPKYLDLPLISGLAKPSKLPERDISPKVDGEDSNEDGWEYAGCVNVPNGPLLEDNKLFDKICYGADKENFYLRLYLSPTLKESFSTNPFLHQMYIYMRNGDKQQLQSPIRLINKTENVSPIMREKFHNELRISMMDNKLYPIRFTKAIQGGLWAMNDTNDVKIAYQNVIDMSVPFEELEIEQNETLEFFFANANFGIKDAYSPQDVMINIKRP